MSYEDKMLKELIERMEGKQDHQIEPSWPETIEINNVEMTSEEKEGYDQIDIIWTQAPELPSLIQRTSPDVLLQTHQVRWLDNTS